MHSIGSLRADYPLSIQKVNTQLLTLNNLKKKRRKLCEELAPYEYLFSF